MLAGVLCTYGPVHNNYGLALYFLNYRHGFVKRGLVGQLVSGVLFFTRGELIAIEVAFIFTGFAATYLLFRPIIFGKAEERVLAAVLLCGPAMLPHLGYLFAQPDITLFLITLCILACWLHLPASIAVWISALLSCLAMLGHEAFSLMFYPLVLAIVWEKCRRGKLAWWMGATQLLLVALVFLTILHFGKLKVSPDQILADARVRTNVGIERQVFDVMASTWAEQHALVKKMYSPGVRKILIMTFLLSVPYFVMLGGLVGNVIRARGLKRRDRVFVSALFCLPAILCVFGHDVSRWIGAGCASATLFLLYAYLSDEPGGEVRRALTAPVASLDGIAWLAYGLMVGPYGAVGIRAADQMYVFWSGR